MKNHQEIKFIASKTISKFNTDKVVYQGQIIHNRTLDEELTRARFAEYTNQAEPMANLALDWVGSFIVHEIALGNRINLGPFSVGLKMRGGLSAANAPFDPTNNELSVELTPGKRIRKAVAELKPVNATDVLSAEINAAVQYLPVRLKDEISTTGSRLVDVFGRNLQIHTTSTGEGIWIENDVGEKLLAAEIRSSDFFRAQTRLEGDIPAGLYWLTVYARHANETSLHRVRRRIRAVVS